MNMRAAFAARIIATSWFGLSGCTPEPEIIVEQGTAVDHGAALFRNPAIAGTIENGYTCGTCHDVDRAASAVVRPGAAMAGVAIRASYWGGQEVELLRAINQCLYYFMTRYQPWTPEETDARAMFAYLESVSGGGTEMAPEPFTVVRDIGDIDAGDSKRGANVFNEACAYCHGAPQTGKGRTITGAPVLPNETLSAHPPDKYTDLERRLVFIEKTRHGGFLGYGGRMPPFALEKLSDVEMADLLAFLGLY